MTPEAQRIAIVKACGYEPLEIGYTSHQPVLGYVKVGDRAWMTPSAAKWLKQIREQDIRCVGNYFAYTATGEIYADFEGPDNGNNGKGNFDYLSDLNAMHEAEKMLTGWQPVNYKDNLRKVVAGKGDEPSAFDLLHATAAQRAEAFLKTLGLWQAT